MDLLQRMHKLLGIEGDMSPKAVAAIEKLLSDGLDAELRRRAVVSMNRVLENEGNFFKDKKVPPEARALAVAQYIKLRPNDISQTNPELTIQRYWYDIDSLRSIILR